MRSFKLYITIIVVSLLSGYSIQTQAQEQFAIIINSKVGQDAFNQSDIRRLYFGFNTQWQNFEKVKPAYTDVNGDAFWQYIKTTKSKFSGYWTKRVFSGNGVAPVEFSDSQKVIDYVNSTDGAIGVIQSSFKDNLGSNCLVVNLTDYP